MRNKYKGSALITALFIMTLISIIITAMTMQIRRDIYKVKISIDYDHQKYAAKAITYWAINELKSSSKTLVAQNSSGVILHYPKNLEKIYPNILLSGNIIDLQSRFNINNLNDPLFRIFFYQLIKNTSENNNNSTTNNLIYAIINWITPYQPSHTNQMIINKYLAKNPSYLPANLIMQNKSELSLVDGINHDVYLNLLPYITTLPDILPINLNTASKKILMSLGNGLSSSQADEIINIRAKNGIQNFHIIKKLLDKFNIPNQQVTTESHYFLITATATNASFAKTFYTVVQRNINSNGKNNLSIIRESLTPE